MAKKKAQNTKAPISGKAPKASSTSPMDVGLLEQMIKLMSANDLSVIEVRDGDKRVLLRRGVAGAEGGTVPMQYAAPTPMPAAAHAPAAVPAAASGAPAAAPSEDAGLVPIKSPMVGTFYSASGPDSKPFVAVGSGVDEESDVCIIEAMKVFNNIKAETRGTIAKILVTNGQTVEFGQPLFLVKP